MLRISSFVLILAAAPLRADLVAPAEATPPEPAQLQWPSTEQSTLGETLPVSLVLRNTAEASPGQRIEVLLRDLLDEAPRVLLVDAVTLAAEDLPAGHAKNLALDPIPPRYLVHVVVGDPEQVIFGMDYTPVTLTLAAADGQSLAREEFRYRAGNEQAFITEARQFLTPLLPLAAPAGQIDSPRLQVWIESSDGDRIRIGGRIAFYFQASVKGYVSLYHFASSGAVQRIYPTDRESFNFVQAGRIYRYPQSGFLELQGPAGEETVKAVLTVLPSNTPRVQPGGMAFKGDPLQIIPTHYPVLFATSDLGRFFALPRHLYTETHIRYRLGSR